MTMKLHRRDAASGAPTSLVILLHGYGADGADLIGLAGPLSGVLPDTTFLAPDAPSACSVNPLGRQWFPISWIDGSSDEAMRAGFVDAAAALQDWLVETMAAEGMTPAQTALIGFSQGTMMALRVGPALPQALAGIVGFSGRLADPEFQPVTRPPVALIHGDRDEVIPVSALQEATSGLDSLGFPVHWHVSKGTGHGIAQDGLEVAAGFLINVLRPSV